MKWKALSSISFGELLLRPSFIIESSNVDNLTSTWVSDLAVCISRSEDWHFVVVELNHVGHDSGDTKDNKEKKHFF